MRLVRHHFIQGVIACLTGLRIGGNKDEIDIMGMDNPIIRHPITGLPYIPGSSLKGRMRSLLELRHGLVRSGGEPCRCGAPDCPVCRLFGPHKAPDHNLGPTRLLVRDAPLTKESEQWLRQAQEDKGVYFAEIKSENWVNRHTGRAGDPRTQERVPAGTRFEMELVLREFEGDDLQSMLSIVREGLSLVQREYLGGSGSRGYGKVCFEDIKFDGRPWPID